jgi:hypothetical protein
MNYIDEAGQEWPFEVETKHAPPPWKFHLGRGANPRFHIQTEGGYQIASTPALDSLSKEENEGRENDAAFIVRAVNAHEELLASAKNALNVLAGVATGQLVGIHPDSNAIRELRLAIAKAEGKL